MSADFNNWEFDYTLLDPTSSVDIYYGIDISYTASSTGLSYFEQIDSFIAAEGQNGGSVTISKDRLLAPDTYTATSTLYSIDLNDCTPDYESGIFCNFFNEFASTTLATANITFSTEGFASYFDPYNSTSTVTNLNASCDSANNSVFNNSLCKLFITLFIPDEDSLSQFNGITDLISEKPPIGYLSMSIDALTNFSSTSLQTAAFTFNSNIQNFSPISSMRSGFAWLIWFLFAWWVFHRIRLFDFHA